MKEKTFRVKVPCLPERLAIGRIDQDMTVAQRKELRALPHIPWRISLKRLLPLRKGVDKLPLPQITRTVQQNRTTRTRNAGSNGRVPPVSLLPGRRITKPVRL